MQSTGSPANAIVGNVVSLYGKAIGTGAAAPSVTADGDRQCLIHTGAASGAPSRGAAGVYTVTVKSRHLPIPKTLQPRVEMVGTTLLDARIEVWNPVTGVLTFRTFTAAGVATDMAAADTAFVKLEVQNSTQG